MKPTTKYLRVPKDPEVSDEEEEEEGEGEEVDAADVVMGYRYGEQVVSITEEEEKEAKFDGGPKSLTLFGFLAQSELKYQVKY